METPTNNHQLFTITKMKRFARTGLLAASGIFLSSGVFIYRAEAQSLLCGEPGALRVEATADATVATRTARQAKDYSKAVAEELVLKQLDLQAAESAKRECPAECPGSFKIVNKDTLNVDVSSEHGKPAVYTDDDDKSDFLEKCKNADAAVLIQRKEGWGEMNETEREQYCEDIYYKNIDDEGYIGTATALGKYNLYITCGPKPIGVRPKNEEPVRGETFEIKGMRKVS